MWVYKPQPIIFAGPYRIGVFYVKYAKLALRLESIQEGSVNPTVALHHLLIRFRKLFGARLTYGLSEAA